jgi:Mg/Co/Ni transporter MgtE
MVKAGDRARVYEAVQSMSPDERLSALRSMDKDARSQLLRLLGQREAAKAVDDLKPGGVA